VNEMLEQLLGPLIAAFDLIFSPLAVFKPHISLLIVSAILTLIVVVLNKLTIKRDLVKNIKTKMEEIRESLTKAQKEGNMEEANKFLSEMMKVNSQYMKQTFKALIISLIVISIFLPWLKYKYEGSAVAIPFSLPLIGSSLSWLYWYILISITIGWVARKLLEGE